MVPFCDDASYDPRQRPEFDIKYRQAVTSEDVFLQVTFLASYSKFFVHLSTVWLESIKWIVNLIMQNNAKQVG